MEVKSAPQPMEHQGYTPQEVKELAQSPTEATVFLRPRESDPISDSPERGATVMLSKILDDAEDLTRAVDYYHYGKKAGQERGRQVTAKGQERLNDFKEAAKNMTMDELLENASAVSDYDKYGKRKVMDIAYTLAEETVRRSLEASLMYTIRQRAEEALAKRDPGSRKQIEDALSDMNEDSETSRFGDIMRLAAYLNDRNIDALSPGVMRPGHAIDLNARKVEDTPAQTPADAFNSWAQRVVKRARGAISLFAIAARIASTAPSAEVQPVQTTNVKVEDTSTLPRITSNDELVAWVESISSEQDTQTTVTAAPTEQIVQPTVTPNYDQNPLQATPPGKEEIVRAPTIEAVQAIEKSVISHEGISDGVNTIRMVENENEKKQNLTAPMVTISLEGISSRGPVKLKFKPVELDAARGEQMPYSEEYVSVYQLPDSGAWEVGVHTLYVKYRLDDPAQKAIADKIVKMYGQNYVRLSPDGTEALVAMAGQPLHQAMFGTDSEGNIKLTKKQVDEKLEKLNEKGISSTISAEGKEMKAKGYAFKLNEKNTFEYYKDRTKLVELIKSQYGDNAFGENEVNSNTVFVLMCSTVASDEKYNGTNGKAVSANLTVYAIFTQSQQEANK